MFNRVVEDVEKDQITVDMQSQWNKQYTQHKKC